MPKARDIAVRVVVSTAEGEAAPPAQAYLFTAGGRLLGTGPVTAGTATITVPAGDDGTAAVVYLGPLDDDGRPPPSAATLKRLGAPSQRVRVVPNAAVKFPLPIGFTPWCRCTVRGRLVKRYSLPDGTQAERAVCNARVTICEVDRLVPILGLLPERDLFRLRDDLLDTYRVRPRPRPGPLPEPDPPLAFSQAVRHSGSSASATPLSADAPVAISALATATDVTHIRHLVVELADFVRAQIFVYPYLWRHFHKDCLVTVETDDQGRFEASIAHECNDRPDLYFSVEQLREGCWEVVYKPPVGRGTHWNYVCGTEVVLDLPDATPCEEPNYDVPRGVTRFVLPYAIGHTPIWGLPFRPLFFPIPVPAPAGWVRADGMVDYDAAYSLGLLRNAPFGHTLDFIHDDSYYIPSDGIRYYRYSFRRHRSGQPENTDATDSTWTPIATALSRWYRLEYSGGRLPTYAAYPVGPYSVGAQNGLFEFKPRTPPARGSDPAGVAVREWVHGNLGEAAARWHTNVIAPAMQADDDADDDTAGLFEVKIELFDHAGAQVEPGPGTFSFIVQNADRTTTRHATDAEVAGGAYVFSVHIDNNLPRAGLPQPSIGDEQASDDCGFLRYASGDSVRVRFLATHPNQHAVFQFSVNRGSHVLSAVSTVPPYIEVGGSTAPTPTGPYVEIDDYYRRDFDPTELVGKCVNAAFAARVTVFGKATNGYHRLQLDAERLIAFALAEDT